MVRTWCVGLVLAALTSAQVTAGLYSGPTDTAHPIDAAIPGNSPLFKEWANSIDPVRTQFAPRGSSAISLTGVNSLGDLDAAEIAAGASPGFLTVTFPSGIRNGAGADFAVFENGFTFGSPNSLFAELAHVEVSTNGLDFARFPSVSTNSAPVTVSGPFAGFDTSNIHNLAGKHASGFGTPFNLDDLTAHPLVASGAVNLANIQYLKLVDIPGNGAFLDSVGNGILDNWLTVATGGFDFRLPPGQGVGVINAIPEPGAICAFGAGALSIAWQTRKHRYRRARRDHGSQRGDGGQSARGMVQSRGTPGLILRTISRAFSVLSEPSDRAIIAQNAKAWDALARDGVPLSKPARGEELKNPLATVDPAGWLGSDIRGWRVLCLAAGGGRHSALYAAAGARVTVVDISGEMLALDRAVAAERGFDVRLVQTSMDELSMFAAGEFDVVVHPVSTCYVADVAPVFQAVARVTRAGGLYISQHKSPTSMQTSLQPDAATGKYSLSRPYYLQGPLPPADAGRLRERGTLEFLHRWEQLFGGVCRAGFAIEDVLEPLHASQSVDPGSFAHRAQYVAPYVRIKARRRQTTPTFAGSIKIAE